LAGQYGKYGKRKDKFGDKPGFENKFLKKCQAKNFYKNIT